METKTYNRSNFHKHTFCVFTEAGPAEINGRVADFKSKSGSSYFFSETGVYRLSDHWSRVANCRWRLESNLPNTSRTKLGFASWSGFHRDNEFEKLYFITVDYQNKKADYQHMAAMKNQEMLLRTASETTKIIRQVRHLLTTDSWADYLEGDIETLREKIIKKLCATNLSLNEIKKNL